MDTSLDRLAAESKRRAQSALLDAIARQAEHTGKEALNVKELELLARAYATVVGPAESVPDTEPVAFVPAGRAPLESVPAPAEVAPAVPAVDVATPSVEQA